MLAYAFGGRGRLISKFKPSLVDLYSKLQGIYYICLKKKTLRSSYIAKHLKISWKSPKRRRGGNEDDTGAVARAWVKVKAEGGGLSRQTV